MTEIELLIEQLEQGFRKKSWHGTTLLGSLRGLKPDTALLRPDADRHNIWEILVHCAYWKYSVWRRIEGAKRSGFPLKGSNWFERSIETEVSGLKSDLSLLKETHLALITSVGQLSVSKLNKIPKGSETTYRDLILGIGAHDLYHAGQIQLIKKLVHRR